MKHNKVMFLVGIAMILCAANFSAQPPDTVWTKTFGGSDADIGKSVQQTSDGGYIITGHGRSFGAGAYDVYLVKTDALGNTVWTKTFDEGGYSAYAYSVQQTTDGGYIIAGYTYTTSSWTDDYYLIKTDVDGNEVWSKTHDVSYWRDDYAYSVQQTFDGGYIVAGTGYYDDLPGKAIGLLKTNEAGNQVWSRMIPNPLIVYNYVYGYSVQQTADSGYIIAGERNDVYLVKTDESGYEEWKRHIGGGCGYSVQQTTDGGYIIAGYMTPPGEDSLDVYVIKTDELGNEEWSGNFGGIGNDRGYSVQQTTEGGYIIAGHKYIPGTNSYDVYLIRLDSSGNEKWQKTIGGSNDDFGESVQQTTDGGYIVTGSTASYGSGDYDFYLIKIEPDNAVVYPGDCDNNGVVNGIDVLPIGRFWHFTGESRDSVSIVWEPQNATPWQSNLAATYADCNGDGIVDEQDVLAIGTNWHKTHTKTGRSFVINIDDSELAKYVDNYRAIYNSLKGKDESVNEMREILLTIIQKYGAPSKFFLSQNVPNPSHSECLIRFGLPRSARVSLKIYDVSGALVQTLVGEVLELGYYSRTWDGRDTNGRKVASGVYFYRLTTGDFVSVKKITILK
jgi:hypothetical protein